MNWSKVFRFRRWLGAGSLLAATLLLPVACQQQEAPVSDTARVQATPAYEAYFGQPPTVAEGTCFAVVAFLPERSAPARLRPLPLFTFTREDLPALTVRHLLTMDRAILARADLVNPFPAGTRLQSLTRESDLMTVDLTIPPGTDYDAETLARVLAQTLEQFPGGARLALTVDGQRPGALPAGGIRLQGASVVDPGPPQLLAARLGAQSTGAGGQQVSLLFDRPVTVERLTVKHRGRAVAGELLLGVFDMVAVLRPAGDAGLAVGQPVEVSWTVSDPLGRQGSGTTTLSLEAEVHP